MSLTGKKMCLICCKHLDKKIIIETEKSKKLLKTCYTHLHEEILRKLSEEFILKQENELQFCRSCFDFASELSHYQEQLEKFKRKVSNLTLLFSLAVLHQKSQINNKNSNSEDSNQNIIELDISSHPFLSKAFKSSSLESAMKPESIYESLEEIKEEHSYDGSVGSPTSIWAEEDFPAADDEIEYNDILELSGNELDPPPAMKNENARQKGSISLGSNARNMSKKGRNTLDATNTIPKFPVVKLYKMKTIEGKESSTTHDTSRKSRRITKRLTYSENESEISEEESPAIKSRIAAETPIKVEEFACGICTRTYPTKEKKNMHEEGHKTDGDRLKCTDCDKTFANAFLVKIHMRLHKNEKPHQCSICDKSFSLSTYLKNHILLHNRKKRYNCPHCDKTFIDPRYVKKHIRIHLGDKRYKCSICNRAFTASCTRNRHQLTHSENEKFKCSFCPKELKTVSSRKEHEKSHTGGMFFQCSSCGKTFANKKDMNRHEKIHTGEKPHQCQYCTKTFVERYQMMRHERKHTGEMKYKCNYCDKLFSNSSSKIVHQRLHTGERPYKCQFCEMSFVCSSARSTHENTHTKANSYKCTICDKTYTKKYSLKEHIRLVHSGGKKSKSYKCKFCFKELSNRSSMIRHEERMHRNEEIVETTEELVTANPVDSQE